MQIEGDLHLPQYSGTHPTVDLQRLSCTRLLHRCLPVAPSLSRRSWTSRRPRLQLGATVAVDQGSGVGSGAELACVAVARHGGRHWPRVGAPEVAVGGGPVAVGAAGHNKARPQVPRPLLCAWPKASVGVASREGPRQSALSGVERPARPWPARVAERGIKDLRNELGKKTIGDATGRESERNKRNCNLTCASYLLGKIICDLLPHLSPTSRKVVLGHPNTSLLGSSIGNCGRCSKCFKEHV